MNTWNYTPKNTLMYSPESVSLTADELNEMQKGVPVINHTNTRISRDHTKGIEILSQAILSARTKTQTNIGHMGVDGRIEESSQYKSYSMVATPSPAPGVGESPIMTWGEIGSTPLRIDTPGPAFKIPDTPAREELLFKLDADNINKRKQNLKSKSDRIRFKAGKGSLTPSQRLKFLSPAAQLLASKTGVVTPTPLRGNYTPHMTPITTPTSSRINRTPLVGSTNSSDSTPISSSLTDNLLKFMEK
uniref:Splicing factor ESS-2 homolog (Trinotate prediction) n=1 Tax=Myxobolus squamalis TaxID=59785 RepID=A0A6B2G2A7_MYXSQ